MLMPSENTCRTLQADSISEPGPLQTWVIRVNQREQEVYPHISWYERSTCCIQTCRSVLHITLHYSANVTGDLSLKVCIQNLCVGYFSVKISVLVEDRLFELDCNQQPVSQEEIHLAGRLYAQCILESSICTIKLAGVLIRTNVCCLHLHHCAVWGLLLRCQHDIAGLEIPSSILSAEMLCIVYTIRFVHLFRSLQKLWVAAW